MNQRVNYLYRAKAGNGDLLCVLCAPDEQTAWTYLQGTGLPVITVELVDPTLAHVVVVCEVVEIDHDKIDRMRSAKLGEKFWKMLVGSGRR
jgi:hypothetical protein